MININVVPHEIGIAIDPNGDPMVTGVDKQAGIMVSIVVKSEYWKAFIKNAQRVPVSGIAPATVEDLAALHHLENEGRNGG